MKKRIFIVTMSVFVLCAAVVSFTNRSSADDRFEARDWKTAVSALVDSVKALQAQIDSLKQQAPGLGEYMTTMQLHAAKLWFAVKASNWDLASYEAGELNETMDGAVALHAFKNNVNISGVLQSVQQTQIFSLQQALASKSVRHFSVAYKQTLEACNGCHNSAGYKFISITQPSAPPVTNQRWGVH